MDVDLISDLGIDHFRVFDKGKCWLICIRFCVCDRMLPFGDEAESDHRDMTYGYLHDLIFCEPVL